MKILVTGHLGYIGSHLMKLLPADTIGLDIKEGNDILTCDLPDADVVIHLAAQSDVMQSTENPEESVKTNVLGTTRLAKRYKDAKFIFASTGGAIQKERAVSPYGLSKFCAEEFVRMLHDNAVILRFANIYGGEGSRSVIDKFLKEEVVIYGDGSQTRVFIHVEDLVRGIADAVNWGSGLYNFGGEDDYSVLELAEAVGKPITFKDWRKGEFLHSSVENTTPGWHSTINPIEYIKQCQQKI